MSDKQRPQSVMLPRIERVVLRNFSLYTRLRTVEADFASPVFCLAGANGLGKSTFLSTLNYAITGAVPRPGLSFLGASEYYEDTLDYSSRYFDGRIAPADRDSAEVELQMSIGAKRFTLVRGMFEPRGLRNLRVEQAGKQRLDLSGGQLTESQRHERYADEVRQATGLTSLAQLAFLHLLVFTFDEERRLLFWSPRVTEQALFLAFGIPPQQVSEAEALQRTYDAAESQARNKQWQATGVRKRLKTLQEALRSPPDDDSEADLQKEHARRTEALDDAGEEHQRLVAAVKEAELAVDEAVTALLAAQESYQRAYSERVTRARAPHTHPIVEQALDERLCGVCGASGASVRKVVSAALREDHCPLCDSAIEQQDEHEEALLQKNLHELGQQVSKLEKERAVADRELKRQRALLEETDRHVRNLSRELERFQNANTRALLQLRGGPAFIDEAERGMQNEINDLLAQKDEEVEKRDRARAALDLVRQDLMARFSRMEQEFIPLLQELAREFLGASLQVDLERRGPHVGLQLSFGGSERQTPDTLSESQRYFMDIALRMALARKLSHPDDPTTLYIDTPEGSLDIAYEGRAGRMFGRFAADGNRIVMTANINTSQLLLDLASVCRRERMTLVQMTEWTELTQVQQEAELLFEQAYEAIERRLDGEDEG
jgi:DNA repair exonuclease SbcCD ATPase subunit